MKENNSELQQKLERAEAFLEHGATPGWVESRYPRAKRFRLPDATVDPVDYFNKLTRYIGPFQKKLRDKYIPLYQQQLASQEDETTTIVTLDERRLANSLIQSIDDPILKNWITNKSLTSRQFREQALTLTSFITSIQRGEVEPVEFPKILNAKSEGKLTLAREKVRQLLAALIISNQGPYFETSKYKWGRQIMELLDYVGGNVEVLSQAIDTLPDLERALIFKASSINLLTTLGYADLDECDEERLAFYLVGAAFIKDIEERDDALELVISAACEREGVEDFDLQRLMDFILKRPYHDLIFEKILESGKYRRFRNFLMQLFAKHETTYYLARYAEESMYVDSSIEEEGPLPWERFYPEQRPRRYGRR